MKLISKLSLCAVLVASSLLPLAAMTAEQVTAVAATVDDFSSYHQDSGTLLLVRDNGKNHLFTSGYSNKKKDSLMKSDDLFEIGSATKVFTGIAIQQLIEQGKLTLQTPIKQFYPSGPITKLATIKDTNHWDQVTIGMLLKHTSGFIDYLNVYEDDEKAMKILGAKGKTYTFDQLIQLAVDHGDANFKPGTQYKYCNTGYIILGDIISKVSKKDWRDYTQTNILDAVGMPNTYFGSRIPKEVRASMPQGYFNHAPSSMPPSLAGSAGEIISNLTDLQKFMTAWSNGKLYAKKQTLENQLNNEFLQMSPMFDNFQYGYAIMKIGNYYGHGGQTFGFQTYIAANTKSNQVFIVGVNDSSVNSMDLLNLVTELPMTKKQMGKTTQFQGPDKSPLKFTGTTWKLIELTSDNLPESASFENIGITFSQDGNRVSGFSGCNSFNGSFTLTKNAIKFGPLMTTRKACPGSKGKVESALLKALDNVDSFSIDNEFRVMNLQAKGIPVLRFKKEQ